MITRFLYNTLAFVYNRNKEIDGETLAYYKSLCFLSLLCFSVGFIVMDLLDYQLKAITGTRLDALPLGIFVITILWLCFPMRKVREHAQVATKKEQKISTIIFFILLFLSLCVAMYVFRL